MPASLPASMLNLICAMEGIQNRVGVKSSRSSGLLSEINFAARAIHLGLESLPDKGSATALPAMSSQLLDALECLQRAMMSRLERSEG